jgi:transposase
MCVNALRGHLTEFGLVAAKGIGHAGELIDMAENDAALPEIAKSVVKVFAEQLAAIQASIAALEKEIAGVHAQSPMSQLLAGIPGVGKIIASAIVASVPDPKVFKSARGFAAWIGLVPRQNSTGGKTKLGSITKKGDRYLRKLLVLGATSALRVAGKRKGALRDWLATLLEKKKSARLASVALANKLARIIWAMMTSGEAFRKDIFESA